MTIAYYTMDEVNRFLVGRWAKSLALAIVCPREPSEADGHSVVLLDLDFLPPGVSLERFLNLPQWERTKVIVHGHNISDGEASRLRASGVRVCRGRVRKCVLIEKRCSRSRIGHSTLSVQSAMVALPRSGAECRSR